MKTIFLEKAVQGPLMLSLLSHGEDHADVPVHFLLELCGEKIPCRVNVPVPRKFCNRSSSNVTKRGIDYIAKIFYEKPQLYYWNLPSE